MDVYTLIEKIEQGDFEGVKDFIEKHPDSINQPDRSGQTPLMLACENGNTSIINLLLEAGGDLEMRDNILNWTALHFAAYWNQPEAVAALLQKPTIQVNPRDDDDRTPLHDACFRGYTDTVGLLLDQNGIDPNVVDNQGDTPLHLAVRCKHYDMVTLMLSQDSVELEVKNHKKMTPLLEAVFQGHLGMMHRLIALGANINAIDGGGNSCLHLAVKRKVFNSEGAPVDILNECCTDLNLKTEERLSGVVVARYLASQGADFHHKNNNNNTVLDLIKDPNLKQKLETFSPPKCLWCRAKEATTKFLPCEHFVTCEKCSKISLKKCLKCGKPVTSTTKVESPKFEDKCVQTEVVSLEIGFQKLDERFLLKVARLLGSNWWQVGIFLGIKSTQLGIIRHDFSGNVQEQSFQMLLYWSTHCDPQEVTMDTLRAALEEAECLVAL